MRDTLWKIWRGETDCSSEVSSLISEGFARKSSDKILLTSKGMNKLNELTVEEIKLKIQEYREVFKGIRPGSMGDYYKVLSNLKWFYSETNGIYTMDSIIAAAKRYIDLKSITSNKLHLRQADYFIKKNVLDPEGRKVIISDLRRSLEEDEDENDFKDWSY